jgi:hypothetical protein
MFSTEGALASWAISNVSQVSAGVFPTNLKGQASSPIGYLAQAPY